MTPAARFLRWLDAPITRRWLDWYWLVFWLLMSAAIAVGPLHRWGWI